jgi:hypothetical protein
MLEVVNDIGCCLTAEDIDAIPEAYTSSESRSFYSIVLLRENNVNGGCQSFE